MKLFGLNFFCIDWEQLYRHRTKQYRDTRQLLAFFRKRERDLMKAVDALDAENNKRFLQQKEDNALIAKLRKQIECQEALIDSLREDELAIRCKSLEDENKLIKERLEKFDEAADKKRAQKAEQARRYRKARKREKENSNIVDFDVLIHNARQIGYDLEMRTNDAGQSSFHLVSRDSGKDVYSAADVQVLIHIIEKRKKEIYGED